MRPPQHADARGTIYWRAPSSSGAAYGAIMKWLLIVGIILLAGWYILAPLFTPGALRPRTRPRSRPHRGSKRRRSDLTVIDGQGRVIDEDID